MRTLLGICLLGLGTLWAENEWELVWPSNYPEIESLPLNELETLPIEVERDKVEVLIGSRGGKVFWGDNVKESNLFRWQILQLPVDFDIEVVSKVNGRWFVGDSLGNLARYTGTVLNQDASNREAVLRDLETEWEYLSLPTRGGGYNTFEISSLGDIVLTLVGSTYSNNYSLYLSDDSGTTWTRLEDYIFPSDIVSFNGQLYYLSSDALYSSIDGRNWNLVWEITERDLGFGLEQELFVIADNSNGGIDDTQETLYASIRYWNKFSVVESLMMVSTEDGIDWVDNQSTRRHFNFDESPESWNPLLLNPDKVNRSHPQKRRGSFSGNLNLFENKVWRFTGSEWVEVLSSTPSQGHAAKRITLWDTLSFLGNNNHIISINDEGHMSEFPLPDFGQPINSFNKLIRTKDSYLAHLSLEVNWKNYNLAVPESSKDGSVFQFDGDNLLACTHDFADWTALPRPYGDDYVFGQSNLIKFGDEEILSSFGNDYVVFDSYRSKNTISGGTIGGYFKRENDTWDLAYSIFHGSLGPGQPYTYIQEEQSWYQLIKEGTGGASILAIYDVPNTKSNNWERGRKIARFRSPFFNDEELALKSPNGDVFVIHQAKEGDKGDGYSTIVVFVERDGTTHTMDLKGLFPKYNPRIDDVKFVNGWYYIIGTACLRTRDFEHFEIVSTPNDAFLVEILGFGNNLYVFTHDAVFRQTLDSGYLDSIERRRNWHQSGWLGWFLILDQQQGNIYHLLLGNARVLFANKQQYWLNTSTLGWIYIYKDWAPWLWRMDDGHWYLLDQDGWPPRAWDYDDQEWVELRP